MSYARLLGEGDVQPVSLILLLLGDAFDASIELKSSYIEAKEEDLVILKSPVGLPGGAIRNQFIDDVAGGMRKPYKCPYHCLITCDHKNSPYCIALALMNAKKGTLKSGFAFAGANASRDQEIVSVKERVYTFREEFEDATHPTTTPGWEPA